jgi:hypothetical protein
MARKQKRQAFQRKTLAGRLVEIGPLAELRKTMASPRYQETATSS